MFHSRQFARCPRRSVASAALAAAAAFCGAGGCVERVLHVESDPPGALVYLNDQEIGRTPLKRDFTWYGTYDVAVRMEGYETLKTAAPVIAPVWQWVPFDLVAEILPLRLTDRHSLKYSLTPTTGEIVDPQKFVARGAEMRSKLTSGKHAKAAPTTRPAAAAKPASQTKTKVATRPATNQP